MSLLFYLKSILYWWSKLSFSWLRISEFGSENLMPTFMVCLRCLTSMPARCGLKNEPVLICLYLPHFCYQESSMGTVMQTPLDSIRKFKTPGKKLFTEQELHPSLYMLETVFNFLHGDLLYVLFWFASNPVFYCKRQFPITGL